VIPIKRRKSVSSSLAKQTFQSISEDTKNTSYEEAAEEFFRHCKIKGLSSETVKFYEKELKQLRRGLSEVDAPLENVRQIQTSHIEDFVEYQQSFGRAINTINSRLRAGRTFFNFCLRKRYIDSNPFDGIQQLRKRHEVGPTFSKGQLKRLLTAPDVTTFVGLRDLSLMLTFAHTGVRLTELTSLRVQDVTFDGKRVQ
jgi:integrase/recombinase XerD